MKKKMNIIVVYDQKEENILMCYRSKEPYRNLYNLVGGKVEENETEEEAAYRELEEETGITKQDIILSHLMDFQYEMSNIELQVYVGKLNKEKILVEEMNHLQWMSINENFYDMTKYAGEGNIYHILENVKIYRDHLLKVEKLVENK